MHIELQTWLTIAAIITGPLAAVLIQNEFDRLRSKKDRRVVIFRTLMAYRASRASAIFVQALNGIETEFYGKRKVIEAWRLYIDHLSTPAPVSDPQSAAWIDRASEQLYELLVQMGESLNYHFDKVTLKRNVYFPTGWNTTEDEQIRFRQAAVKVLEGSKNLKVEVVPPIDPFMPPRRN